MLWIAPVALAAAMTPIARTSDPALSPDGCTIVFCWQGDLWTVPTSGGEARRVTVHPARESSPRWSPDGKTIVFASDRFGSADLFAIDPNGRNLRRLTFESSTEAPTAVTATHAYGHTNAWGRGDLFRVSLEGGDLVRLTGHPFEIEHSPTVSPDGTTVALVMGASAGAWRNPAQRGSNTGKIWTAEMGAPLTNYRKLTKGDQHDMFPTFLDSRTIAFVSNRSGAPNVWTLDTSSGRASQVTRFQAGTVRSLTASADGTRLAFQKDSRIWIAERSKGEAKPIDVFAPADAQRDPVQKLTVGSSVSSITLSPNGRRVVFESRGDVFIAPDKGGTVRRITNNPAYDGQPQWADDQTLVYVAADMQGKRRIVRQTLDGPPETLLEDDKDLVGPIVSPDRKKIAFQRGDRELSVANIDGSGRVLVAAGDFGSGLTGSPDYSWAPDSAHLVYRTQTARGHSVMLVTADGAARTLIARVGKSLSRPQFSADGSGVFFTAVEGLDFSEWRDSKSPLYFVDFQPRRLEFSEDDLDKIDEPKEDQPADPKVPPVHPDVLRLRRALTEASVSGAWPGPDGKTIYANVDGQFSSVEVKTGAVKAVAGITGSVSEMAWDSSRKRAVFIQGGKPLSLSLGGQPAPLSLQGQYTVVNAEEEKALFSEAWWAMDRLYYRPDMNGRDWQAIKSEFSRLVGAVQSREDFYDLLDEMMERLDSSHVGANPPAAARAQPGVTFETGWLGVEWDWRALDADGSLVVADVVSGGPADHPESRLEPGDKIVSIDGTVVTRQSGASVLLADKAERKVVLNVERNGTQRTVTIKPLRYAARNGLIYQGWVRWNRTETERLSKGRIGYLHIQGMDTPSLGVFLKEIETELDGKKGVIIDVRFNGGGFTSHIILNVMRKEPWLIRTTRDNDHKFSENVFRGNALELPAACLINQYSFSNAEIFAEGFRRMKLGPIIGEATAGGVIGTGSYRLWDGGSVRMPGSGAFTIDGENLERNGRRPDFEQPRDPNAEADGRDVQLERAVQELLRRLR